MGTVEADTMRYDREQSDLTSIHEGIEKEVEKMNDHQLIEFISDDITLRNDFYDFIMADLKAYYNPSPVFDTKLGGIPNLLIELFQPENYLTYFWDLSVEKQQKVRKMIIETMFDRQASEVEE